MKRSEHSKHIAELDTLFPSTFVSFPLPSRQRTTSVLFAQLKHTVARRRSAHQINSPHTMASYMDVFLDSVNGIPYEIARQYQLMELLDRRCEALLRTADDEADRLFDQMTDETTHHSAATLSERTRSIAAAYRKASELADDKCQVANQVYDMVDRFVRRLDVNLIQFKEDVADALAKSDHEVPQNLTQPGQPAIEHLKDMMEYLIAKEQQQPQPTIKKVEPAREVNRSQTTLTTNSSIITDAADELPVDPNEPKFCMCRQVSYGSMVACDNASCSIEWFHFDCVSLSEKPKGSWFCPNCLDKTKV